MRFPILALGALGLAGLTIGAAVNNDASPSATYSASVETSLSRWHPTYTASGEPWLTRTHSHSGLPASLVTLCLGILSVTFPLVAPSSRSSAPSLLRLFPRSRPFPPSTAPSAVVGTWVPPPHSLVALGATSRFPLPSWTSRALRTGTAAPRVLAHAAP
jgi:hypothetical protein